MHLGGGGVGYDNGGNIFKIIKLFYIKIFYCAYQQLFIRTYTSKSKNIKAKIKILDKKLELFFKRLYKTLY